MEQTTPLTRTFKFWFQNYQKSDESDFAHSLLPIATVNSLEQFWAYYQHLRRPSHIEERIRYRNFRPQPVFIPGRHHPTVVGPRQQARRRPGALLLKSQMR